MLFKIYNNKKNYVAEIIREHRQYKFDRKFLNTVKIESEDNNEVAFYKLEEGKIYEVKDVTTDKEKTFYIVKNDNAVEIAEQMVLEIIENRRAERQSKMTKIEKLADRCYGGYRFRGYTQTFGYCTEEEKQELIEELLKNENIKKLYEKHKNNSTDLISSFFSDEEPTEEVLKREIESYVNNLTLVYINKNEMKDFLLQLILD